MLSGTWWTRNVTWRVRVPMSYLCLCASVWGPKHPWPLTGLARLPVGKANSDLLQGTKPQCHEKSHLQRAAVKTKTSAFVFIPFHWSALRSLQWYRAWFTKYTTPTSLSPKFVNRNIFSHSSAEGCVQLLQQWDSNQARSQIQKTMTTPRILAYLLPDLGTQESPRMAVGVAQVKPVTWRLKLCRVPSNTSHLNGHWSFTRQNSTN